MINNKMSQPMTLLTSKSTVEWYTPKEILDLVRSFYGGIIDLDPASCAKAQKVVKAKEWFGLDHKLWRNQNGLERKWHGKVFCNPPYNGSTTQWVKYAVNQWKNNPNVTNILLLVNSSPGYKWYEDLWNEYPVCSIRERLWFTPSAGGKPGQAKKGSSLVYLGSSGWEVFGRHFEHIGKIILPYSVAVLPYQQKMGK